MRRMAPLWTSVATLLTSTITVGAGETAPGTTVVLSGRITDPAGNPVSHAPVRAEMLIPYDTDSHLIEVAPPVAGQVSPDGHYRIALAPGSYQVGVYPPAHSPWLGTSIPVEITADSTLDISLGAAALLKVRVTDPEGHPVEGATIIVYAPGGAKTHCCTGSDGLYETKLAVGDYEAEIRGSDGMYARTVVSVNLSDNASQEVFLQRPGMGPHALLYSVLLLAAAVGVLLVMRFGNMPAEGLRMTRSFLPLWVAASGIGGGIGLVIPGYVVTMAVASIVGDLSNAMGGSLLCVSIGAGLGAGQAIVLSKAVGFARTSWWVLAASAGSLLGMLIVVGLSTSVYPAAAGVGRFQLDVLGPAVVFGVMGLAQWMILRREVAQAGWWIVASLVSGIVAGLVAGAYLGGLPSTAGTVAVAAVSLALASSVTGFRMYWLIQTHCREPRTDRARAL